MVNIMYDKETLSKIIGSDAVNLIDSLIESRLIIKTGIKDGQKVIVDGQIMISVCNAKATQIGYAIINHILSSEPENKS